MKSWKKVMIISLLAAAVWVVAAGVALPVSAKQSPEVLIKSLQGNVINTTSLSTVKLLGRKQNNSPYYKDLRIEVVDADGAVVSSFVPGVSEGYSPDIMLGDFGLDNGLEQVFYGVNSGGSGGFGFFYLYSMSNGDVRTVFDYNDFANNNVFVGRYLDNYKAEVVKQGSNDKYLIDLSLRSDEYKDMIWGKDGKLISPKVIDISGVNTVFPYYNYLEQNYQLLVYQRITGLYGADGLGYITTQQRYNDGKFETFFQGLEIFPN